MCREFWLFHALDKIILGLLIGRSLPILASDWLIFAPDDRPLWPVITFYTCHEVRRDQTK